MSEMKIDNKEFTQGELDKIKTIKLKDAINKSLSSENEELINRYLKTQVDIKKLYHLYLNFKSR